MEKCKQCYRYDSTGQKECAVCDFQEIYIKRSKTDRAIEELRKEIEENHLNVIKYADGEWIVKDFVYGAIDRLKRNIGE